MKYTKSEVMQFVDEEDVKFIRLAFCDVFGKQKNISIMPGELPKAFSTGISIDASAVRGFDAEGSCDLLLHPDPDTLAILPWRPEHGRVVRMYCTITHTDGTEFKCDTRTLLIKAVNEAKKQGVSFEFGVDSEFCLFLNDENGNPTQIPYDKAGYMDIAPDDRGENVRREICLSLEQMGITPESSHHEEGPGQNKISFRYSDPLSAADNAQTFMTVAKTIAGRNGLFASFAPKPLSEYPGNGMHIHFSVSTDDDRDVLMNVIAGILTRICDMTLFLNPAEESYKRLGHFKAPSAVTWSYTDRSALIRIPSRPDTQCHAELRSPDREANPYLVLALLIRAGLEGINSESMPSPDAHMEPGKAFSEGECDILPTSLEKALEEAKNSVFVRDVLPEEIRRAYNS